MKRLALIAALLVVGCGGTGATDGRAGSVGSGGTNAGAGGSSGHPRTAAQVCNEMCGWPDECFTALGVPVQGAECMQACEAQVEIVGVECVSAISNTIDCLGTCDLESLSDADALRCQGQANAISDHCE